MSSKPPNHCQIRWASSLPALCMCTGLARLAGNRKELIGVQEGADQPGPSFSQHDRVLLSSPEVLVK